MKRKTWDTGKDRVPVKEELDQNADAVENKTVADAPAAEGDAAPMHRGAVKRRTGGNYIWVDGQHVKQP